MRHTHTRVCVCLGSYWAVSNAHVSGFLVSHSTNTYRDTHRTDAGDSPSLLPLCRSFIQLSVLVASIVASVVYSWIRSYNNGKNGQAHNEAPPMAHHYASQESIGEAAEVSICATCVCRCHICYVLLVVCLRQVEIEDDDSHADES